MRVLIGVVVWIVALLLLTIPLSVLFLFKLILIVVPHRCRCRTSNNTLDEDDYDVLPLAAGDCIVSVDSSWKKSIVNVGFVLKVGGKVDVNQFREHFANCFNLSSASGDCESKVTPREKSYDKFFSYLINRGGYAFRACRKSLKLSDYIVEKTLKIEENYGEGDNYNVSLEVFLAQWMLQEYREHCPCWEVVVISIPATDTSKNSQTTAIALKIHHGLCDGYSLLHIIDKLTGARSPYIIKEFQDGFGVQFKQMLNAPLHLGRLGGLPPEKNPFRVYPANPSSECKYEWMYSFTSFPLKDLKLLRKENGNVHMFSVIWTVLTGAMRRFLEDEKVEEIPEFIKVGNTLAWPKHPAMSSGTKNKICNHWVAGIFNVPLREPDPLIRLQQIEQDYMLYHSVGLDKYVKRVMFPILWTMPGSFLEKSTSKDLGISGGVTSLIGCDSYSLLGCPVMNIHPILCIHDNAPYLPISCFTFSHSGRMEVTIGANPKSIVKNKQTLEKLCRKLCHDELQSFLTVTKP